MPKKADDRKLKAKKEKLGELLAKCRGETSLRKLAEQIGLPHSNLKYIEDGVNAPTPEIYEKLIATLKPDVKTRNKMDELYMAIRETPPPDVCNTILQNKSLITALRPLDGITLTADQSIEIQKLILSIAEANRKGETANGKAI